jgi:cell volume regulation protein A
MISPGAWQIAGAGVVIIYASRWLILKVLRQEAAPRLLWIAPRGLITVLLFLNASETGKLKDFPFGSVMLIVLATAAMTALAHRQPALPAVAAAVPGPAPLPPE